MKKAFKRRRTEKRRFRKREKEKTEKIKGSEEETFNVRRAKTKGRGECA